MSFYPPNGGYAPAYNQGFSPSYPQGNQFPPIQKPSSQPPQMPPPSVLRWPAQSPPPGQMPTMGMGPPPPQYPPPGQMPPMGMGMGQPDPYQQPSPYSGNTPLATRSSRAVSVWPQLLRRLAPNEWVEVNLQARGWVLGIVLATVELFDAIAGWGYKIRFKARGESDQERVFPHDPDRIRLPQNSNYS